MSFNQSVTLYVCSLSFQSISFLSNNVTQCALQNTIPPPPASQDIYMVTCLLSMMSLKYIHLCVTSVFSSLSNTKIFVLLSSPPPPLVQSLFSSDLTMGRIFLDHIGGTRLFSCANCDTILTNRSELISTRFTGATGRAFLFNKVQWQAVKRDGSYTQDTNSQCLIPGLKTHACACVSNPAGGEPAVQRGPGQGDAHRPAHGEGRQLQELQQQAGLDLRVCHRGQSAVQGGTRHPGEGAGSGERGLRGARPLRQLMSLWSRIDTKAHSCALLPLSSTPLPLCCMAPPADFMLSEVMADHSPHPPSPPCLWPLRPLLI